MKGRSKGLLIGLLISVLLFPTAIIAYVDATPRDELPDELHRYAVFDDLGQGDTMVELAQWELNYYEENSLAGGKRYWGIVNEALGWTFPDDTDWCACFVLCCAYQCGYISEDGCFGDFSENGGNWIFWCGGVYDYLVNTTGLADGYDTRSCNYKPVPGDLVLFSPTVGAKRPDHIGIVKEVTEDGKLITIEGNSHNSVRSNTYRSYEIGSYAYRYDGQDVLICSYIHPFYPLLEEEPSPSEPKNETGFKEMEAIS